MSIVMRFTPGTPKHTPNDVFSVKWAAYGDIGIKRAVTNGDLRFVSIAIRRIEG